MLVLPWVCMFNVHQVQPSRWALAKLGENYQLRLRVYEDSFRSGAHFPIVFNVTKLTGPPSSWCSDRDVQLLRAMHADSG